MDGRGRRGRRGQNGVFLAVGLNVKWWGQDFDCYQNQLPGGGAGKEGEGAARHKMGAEGGREGGGWEREVPVTGMREMCSILPESKFPPIRYCHRTPKANPADAAEKVQLTGRRATFKSKFTKIHKNMSTIGLVQRQTSGIFRTTEAHPNLPFRCFYALCHNLKI